MYMCTYMCIKTLIFLRDTEARSLGSVSHEKAVLYLDWNVGADATSTTEAAASQQFKSITHISTGNTQK